MPINVHVQSPQMPYVPGVYPPRVPQLPYVPQPSVQLPGGGYVQGPHIPQPYIPQPYIPQPVIPQATIPQATVTAKGPSNTTLLMVIFILLAFLAGVGLVLFLVKK